MYSVLYVDDEATLLELCKIYLESSGDFRIDTSTSAREALEKIQDTSYDAIVSDYQMPEMDGIALLKKVRSAWGDIPFILFTGKGREEVVIEAINNGADFYLQKGGEPTAQFAELVHKIKRAIEIKAAYKEMLEIVEGSPIPKFVIDHDHRVIFWNRALEEYSGIPADAIVGTTDHWKAFYDHMRPCLADLIVDTNIDGIARWYGGKYEKSSVVPGAYEATDFFPRIKDGTWLFFTAAPLRDHSGHIIGAIETLQDVTSLRKKEGELRSAYDRAQDAFRQAQESERLYRNVVEDQTEFISRFLPDGTHVFVNEAYCRYFGLNRDEILGHRFRPDIVAEDQERVRRFFKTLTPDHPVDSIEHRIIMPDGGIRWQRWSDRAIFDPFGTVTEYQSVGRDITDHKRIEQALRESEERYRLLLEHASDAVFVHEMTEKGPGTYIEVNPKACRLTGYTREELLHMSPGDLDTQEQQARSPAIAREIYVTKHALFQTDLVSKDGRKIPVEISATIFDLHGQPVALSFVRDITNRKKAEGALRESEERFRDLTNLLPQTIYEIDTSGRITFANRFAFEAFGYSPDELDAGLYVMQMIHPDDRERALQNIKRILDGENISGIEYRALRKDGTTFPVIIYGNRIQKDNRVTGLRGVIADISEQKTAADAIRKREQLLTNFMRNLPIGLFRTTPGPAGRRIMANPILATMHGFDSVDEFMKTPVSDSYADPLERNRISDRLLQEGKLSNVAIHLKKKDGELFWANLSAIAVPGPGGETAYFDGVVEDITERRRAEDVLRESEATARALINAPTDSILLLDATGVILDANVTAAQRLGRKREDLIGVIADKVLPGDVARMRREKIKKVIETKKPVRFEDTRDGIWFDTVAYPVLNSNGSVIRLAIIARDITDRVRVEDALRESEDRYRKLVDITPDAILVHQEGRIVYMNPAGLDLLGVADAVQVIGKPVLDYIHTDYREMVRANIEKDLKGEGTPPLEVRMLRLDGGTVTAEGRGVRTVYDGKPAIQVALRDITQRKLAEKELLEANRKLTMLSDITRHDILNKVSVLMGNLALAKTMSHNPVMAAYIEKLESATVAIRNHIEFTRIYQDLGTSEPIWHDLDRIISGLGVASPVILHKDLNTIQIFADPILEKVFSNLIDNALRHGENVTTIRVTSHESSEGISIIWEDDGIGIPAEEKEKIFDRGYGRNTGLGLFLCREILSVTGITIKETGEPGNGARFEITVPKGAYGRTGNP